VRSIKARVPNGNGNVVLVDTPGFDGYKKNAENILVDIYDWLRRKSVPFHDLKHK